MHRVTPISLVVVYIIDHTWVRRRSTYYLQ